MHNNGGAFNNSSGVDMDDSDDDLDLNNDFEHTTVSPQPPPTTTNSTNTAGGGHGPGPIRKEQPQTKTFSPMKAGKLFAAAMEKSSAVKAKKSSSPQVKSRASGGVKTKAPSQPVQRAENVEELPGQDNCKPATKAVIPVAQPEILVEEGGKQSMYFNPNPSKVRRAHPNKVPSTLSQSQTPSSSSIGGGSSSMDTNSTGGNVDI